MKRALILTLASFVMLAHTHGQQKDFSLDGNIPALKTPKVYLIYSAGGRSIKDSTTVTNGKFHFNGMLDGPTYSELWASDNNWSHRQYLENAKMSITQKDPAGAVNITGSVSEKESELVNKEYVLFGKQRDSLDKLADEWTRTDSAGAIKRYHDGFMALQTGLCSRIVAFAKTHPESVISARELNKWAVVIDLKELQSLYAAFDKRIQASGDGQGILNQIEIHKHTDIGVTAANFTQKNDKGENIDLASFRGKYVLVDFWASWCGPCRQENPNVVKVYSKYKTKGFEILGVSLDQNADKWKEAIAKDQLSWAHVSDLKGWGNEVAVQYGVKSVPANFLIDPNGVIIAKNLRGQDLDNKLAELFN